MARALEKLALLVLAHLLAALLDHIAQQVFPQSGVRTDTRSAPASFTRERIIDAFENLYLHFAADSDEAGEGVPGDAAA